MDYIALLRISGTVGGGSVTVGWALLPPLRVGLADEEGIHARQIHTEISHRMHRVIPLRAFSTGKILFEARSLFASYDLKNRLVPKILGTMLGKS